MCSELFGRLAYFREDFPETVGRLVTESAEVLEEEKHSNLLPIAGCFQPPGRFFFARLLRHFPNFVATYWNKVLEFNYTGQRNFLRNLFIRRL